MRPAAVTLLLAGVVAASAGAAGHSRTSFQLVFDGSHNAALLHEGQFTTSATFCPSGSAEDVSLDAPSETAVRRFRCSGSAGEFSARVTPLPAEHGGIGTWQVVDGAGPLATLRGKGTWTSTRTAGRPDDPATITFRSSWAGVVDFDTDPPRVAVTKASAKKLRKPKGTYTLKLSLSLEDDAGGPVSYQVEVNDPRTRRGLAFRIGQATAPTVSLTIRLKVPAPTRTLQLRLSATDVVGNEATAAAGVRLR